MMEYIATRDGVELPVFDLEKEFATIQDQPKFEQELYVKYIATRKGVDKSNSEHGLFGKMLGMKNMGNIADLELARGYVENLAHAKKTVYNAVISLKSSDAIAKGLLTRTDWEDLVRNNINEIARQMELSPRTIEYAAAVHMEKDHPHIHLMYWDTEQTIGKNFISPEKSNDIRVELIKREFGEEIKSLRLEKDMIHDELIGGIYKNDDSILKSSKNAFQSMSVSEVYAISKGLNIDSELLNRRGAGKNIPKLTSDLLLLEKQIKKAYPKGALKYQFMPEEIKNTLDELALSVIKSNPDIAKKYNKYIEIVKKQAILFGGNRNVNSYVKKAKLSLQKEIGNKALSAIKDIRSIEFNAGKVHRAEQNQKHMDYINSRNRAVTMNFMQSVLDTVFSATHAAISVGNKKANKISKDMTKAQKLDLIKKSQDNTLEWGD